MGGCAEEEWCLQEFDSGGMGAWFKLLDLPS